MSKKKRNPLLTIILTVFIDLLGLSIIFPVIPAIFFEGDSTLFAADVAEETKNLYYGALLTAFPIMQFFGAPILGALSDRFGRKPILILSITGALIGYLLFALALGMQSIWLLIFSRMLPGFMGGNISIVQSAIADVSEGKNRTKNFGLVGAAFGFGFVIGPALGGILADDTYVSWFNHTTPFYFTAALSFLNLISIMLFFPETLKEKTKTKISALTGFRNIKKSFALVDLRKSFLVVFLISMGFAFFTQFFSVLLIQDFNYTESDIGFLYGWIGICLIVTQTIIVRRTAEKVSSSEVLKYSIILLAIALILLPLPNQSWWFYLIMPLIALSKGLTTPNLTTVVSMQARQDQQGEILGINQSMNSVGQIFPPMIGGVLIGFANYLPLIISSICVLIAWVVFKNARINPAPTPQPE